MTPRPRSLAASSTGAGTPGADSLLAALPGWLTRLGDAGLDRPAAAQVLGLLLAARLLERHGALPVGSLASGGPGDPLLPRLALAVDGPPAPDPRGTLAASPLPAVDPGLLRVVLDDIARILDRRPPAPGPDQAGLDLLGLLHERHGAPARREQGAYYTGPAIVERIVEDTVGVLARAAVDAALLALAAADRPGALRQVRDGLFGLRILDPACGAGAFLVAALRVLARELQRWLAAWRRVDGGAAATVTAGEPTAQAPAWRDAAGAGAAGLLVGCLYGVDRDPGAVFVARRNLQLELARLGVRWRPRLDGNLLAGDALLGPAPGRATVVLRAAGIDPARLAAERRRQAAAPAAPGATLAPLLDGLRRGEQLLAEAGLLDGGAVPYELYLPGDGLDCVLGNPPFLGEEDHRELFRAVAASPLLAERYEGKMDYSSFFLHLGLDLLRPGGLLGFVLPTYFVRAEGARRKLNPRLAGEAVIEEVFDLSGHLAFAGSAPGQHNLLLRLRRAVDGDARPQVVRFASPPTADQAAALLRAGRGAPGLVHHRAPCQRELLDAQGGLRLLSPSVEAICLRIEQGAEPLTRQVAVSQGIVPGPDRLANKALGRWLLAERGASAGTARPGRDQLTAWATSRGLRAGEGVFVLDAPELQALGLGEAERRLLRPYHPARDLRPGWARPTTAQQLLYLTSTTCPTLAPYPALERHLQRFRPLLELRRETAQGSKPYFHLHWPRREQTFLGPKVLGVRQTAVPTFVAVPGPYFVDLAVNVLVPRHLGIDPTLLAALLCSAPAHFWFFHRGKRKGELLQLDGGPVEHFPLRWPADPGPLTALARELARWRGAEGPAAGGDLAEEFDRRAAELYGVGDVPLELLRNPGLA